VDRVHTRLQSGRYVTLDNTRQPDDLRVDRRRDPRDRVELVVRHRREPRLDRVDAHLRQRRRYLSFGRPVERDTWRLLAVAQRRVEESYAVDLRRAG
jgi:hypothetical protein